MGNAEHDKQLKAFWNWYNCQYPDINSKSKTHERMLYEAWCAALQFVKNQNEP